MDRILIDSDVILDFFFDRNPFAEYSSRVIGLCETNRVKGYTTPVIYSNLYYILRQNEYPFFYLCVSFTFFQQLKKVTKKAAAE